MMASNETGPINIGNPYHEISINQLVELFQKLTEIELNVVHLESTGDDPKIRKPDIKKAQEKLGWEPLTNIEEGLTKTFDYFLNNPNNTDFSYKDYKNFL